MREYENGEAGPNRPVPPHSLLRGKIKGLLLFLGRSLFCRSLLGGSLFCSTFLSGSLFLGCCHGILRWIVESSEIPSPLSNTTTIAVNRNHACCIRRNIAYNI